MNPCQFTKFYEGMTDVVYTKRSAGNWVNIHYKKLFVLKWADERVLKCYKF